MLQFGHDVLRLSRPRRVSKFEKKLQSRFREIDPLLQKVSKKKKTEIKIGKCRSRREIIAARRRSARPWHKVDRITSRKIPKVETERASAASSVTSLTGVSSSTSTAPTLTAATVLLHSGAELLAACTSGDAAAAMRLLGTEGIDVNAKDKQDVSPTLRPRRA